MDTRERLAFEVREILKATGHTAILVTHNQAEAFAIADRIGVMSKGRIAQWDTPYNLHHHPADAFVRDFIRSEALEEQREQVRARPLNATRAARTRVRAARAATRPSRPPSLPSRRQSADSFTFCDKALRPRAGCASAFPPLPASSHTA